MVNDTLRVEVGLQDFIVGVQNGVLFQLAVGNPSSDNQVDMIMGVSQSVGVNKESDTVLINPSEGYTDYPEGVNEGYEVESYDFYEEDEDDEDDPYTPSDEEDEDDEDEDDEDDPYTPSDEEDEDDPYLIDVEDDEDDPYLIDVEEDADDPYISVTDNDDYEENGEEGNFDDYFDEDDDDEPYNPDDDDEDDDDEPYNPDEDDEYEDNVEENDDYAYYESDDDEDEYDEPYTPEEEYYEKPSTKESLNRKEEFRGSSRFASVNTLEQINGVNSNVNIKTSNNFKPESISTRTSGKETILSSSDVIYHREMTVVEFIRKNPALNSIQDVVKYFDIGEIKKAIADGDVFKKRDRLII